LVRAVEALTRSDRLFALAKPPRPDSVTVDHAGAVVGPVEAITCPEVEPAGLSNWIGVVVAPNASAEKSASTHKKIFFT
jgi:hypothetical protein